MTTGEAEGCESTVCQPMTRCVVIIRTSCDGPPALLFSSTAFTVSENNFSTYSKIRGSVGMSFDDVSGFDPAELF